MQYSDTNDNEDGMKEIGEWANLAKDLYSVFNDQSDQQDADSPVQVNQYTFRFIGQKSWLGLGTPLSAVPGG